MLRFAARRVLLTLPVLFGVVTLVFSLVHLVPGDPAQAMLGDAAAPADVAELRAHLGLDRPLVTQYGEYLARLSHGNLGQSLRYGTPVAREYLARLPKTAELAVCAMAVALALAVPLGLAGAVYRGRAVDHLATTLSLVGVSMPNFWLGPLLAIVVSIDLGLLPVSGTGTWAHFVLPAVTLCAALAAIGWVGYARLARGQVLQLRELEYVQAARAVGASAPRVLLRHIVPGIIPALMVQATLGMAGAIIAEASLSFLGLGVQPPTPSWGRCLTRAVRTCSTRRTSRSSRGWRLRRSCWA